MKYVRVMNGLKSHMSGYEFKLNEVNISEKWNPFAKEMNDYVGFNFSNEENILRWLIRGNTLYDVELVDDSEVVNVKNDTTPNGIFVTNKMIIKNPKEINDEVAFDLYKKSNMPEKTYYKTLAVLAIRNCYNTCLELIKDRVNENNIDLVLEEYISFSKHINDNSDTNDIIYNEVLEILKEIKSNLLISLVVDKDPFIKELTKDKVINLTGQSGSGKSYYAKEHFSSDNYLIVDTDDIFSESRFNEATGINKELGEMFRKKYDILPEIGKDFDLIYNEIIDYCRDKEKIIVIDCAQFHCVKDINILKGKMIIIRTSINKCYERCIERYKNTKSNYSLEDLEKYSNKKKGIFKWYKGSNEFIKKINEL